MSSLVTAAEKADAVQIIDDIFDTWSRDIVVNKEPIKTPVNSPPTDGVFGYGSNQSANLFTETPVTGIFPALIRYHNQPWGLMQEADVQIKNLPTAIKVRRDCRDFINQEKTLTIQLDENTFYLDGNENKQTYLGTEYYIFNLRGTL